MKKLEEMTFEERLLRKMICDLRNETVGGFENMMMDYDEEALKELMPNGFPTREEIINIIYNEVMDNKGKYLRTNDCPMALEKRHIHFMGEKFVRELIEDRVDYDIRHNGWAWLEKEVR